jgi:NAD(P)-dependent dehydrogenase (short-subunit alcohol dehydrogenase family)
MANLSMFDLTGKVAIVTGGYWGIGRGIADGLAEAGADIVICARHFDRCQQAAAEIETLGVKTLPIKCDISNRVDIEGVVSAAMKEFGKIDILINNAAITGAAKRMVDLTDTDWDQTMDINLRGPFLFSRAVATQMIKQNSGKIINVGSISSFMPIPNSGDYCATKGALLMLTKVMALELIRYNINVNLLCPGFFDTHFNPAFGEKAKQEASKRIPIQRFGNVNEVKGLAIFLASSASDYLVGSAVLIDGGISLK